ncbi:MAG TPA: amylo-alpha-1,6-glucosidase [Candidatus Dormibacteraeota bacterium]|nr:amylo-alpha-1,6-glucosidase [Candidatus Dormibacteraeota bacterium]
MSVEDIVRLKDQYYVRATSALADDRTRVLKYGDTFAVLNRFGDIEHLGFGQFGLFHSETRYLSRMTLQLNHQQPMLLSSTIREDNAFLAVDMTNFDTSLGNDDSVPRETIHIFRSKFLDSAACYEQVRLINYGLQPLRVSLSFQFEADFADIFEVRGTKRPQRGQRLTDYLQGDSVFLPYRGLDSVLRITRIAFSPMPRSLTTSKASYEIHLEPKKEYSLFVTTCCDRDSAPVCTTSYSTAFEVLHNRQEHERLHECQLSTSNKRFNAWLRRSEADLRMLIDGNPEGPYPYAGVPWFNTVFGRDGIITSLECLWIAPEISKTVLQYLANTQATEVIPEQDAEPGKILHEMRRGEMATLKEVPFGRYYGSVDSTPLFIILAAGYFLRTGDREFLKTIWSNVQAALRWIDTYGDSDGDGFVEYSRRSPRGLVHQGWKDSSDSIFHADGRLAEPPIALCEVQAYVYAAKRSGALLAGDFGDGAMANRLTLEADRLQLKFEEAFWCDDLEMYALALDGQKQPCKVLSSNAGQTLFCKIASRQHAGLIAKSLMSTQLYSGWGIRTIGASELRYNPMSYHNGSIWPHDNALIGLGLSLYGFQDVAASILNGVYETSLFMELHRLPELFCGFHKRLDSNGPTLYPVACAPQAWAAGAPYLLLRACLGLSVRALERQIHFHNPVLPANVDEVHIESLRVLDAACDLVVRRHPGGCSVDVLRKQGDVEVIKSA